MFKRLVTYVLFVLAIMFSRKWKVFFIKLSHFPFQKKKKWKTISKNKQYFLCWPKIVFLWLIFFYVTKHWKTWKTIFTQGFPLKQTESYIFTFLNRKNSGVQTAPKSRATSCDCNWKYTTKYKAHVRSSNLPAILLLRMVIKCLDINFK